MTEFIISLAIFIFGCVIWGLSASTIGTECERLGSFYVGNTTYTCQVKK